jgi:hypothetical protein
MELQLSGELVSLANIRFDLHTYDVLNAVPKGLRLNSAVEAVSFENGTNPEGWIKICVRCLLFANIHNPLSTKAEDA